MAQGKVTLFACLVGLTAVLISGSQSTTVSASESVPVEESLMTIHKVGRRRIPVRVTINHQEKTIWSVPVSTKTEGAVHHHELETIYDFQNGKVIYRGDNICYLEEIVDLEFDQVLQAVKEQSLHEVFVRQAPRTLFVVNATLEPISYELLNTVCPEREIHMLVSNPEIEQEASEIVSEGVRSKRSADYNRRRHDDYQQPQSTSSSAWAKATLESAEARVDGNGYAQAYSQLGDGHDSYPSSANGHRRLEANTASGTFVRPSTRSLSPSNTGRQQQQTAHFSLQYQSPEKGVPGAMPAFQAPLMATGSRGFMAPPERSGLSSTYSSSSSYSSTSSLGAADLQSAMSTGRVPVGNTKGPGAPASWTGPIPRDATVTQTAGSAHKTYTWKVTDANGYTTTHWYSGPLGPDRTPMRISIPQEHTLPAPSLGRRPVASWTGPIPMDATITQTSGSSYKTYTWKVTDENGYTTTHWYSGPLGPDRAPVRLGLDFDSESPAPLPQQNLPAHQRRVSESRVIQQQQQQSVVQQQQQQRHQRVKTHPQAQPQPQQPRQQQEVHHMVGQVEQQQPVQQQVNLQQHQFASTSESVQRISQPQQQQQQLEMRQQQEQQRRIALMEQQERDRQRQREEQQLEEERRAAAEEQERQLQRQREQQQREQQQREQQLREQQLREQQLREQQQREQQLREQQQREQQLREQQQREQQLREQQLREQQQREQQLREQREQQLREQQLRDQQQREQERRAALEEEERQLLRQREMQQREQQRRAALEEHERQQLILQKQREQQQYLRPTAQVTGQTHQQQQVIHQHSSIKAAQPAIQQPAQHQYHRRQPTAHRVPVDQQQSVVEEQQHFTHRQQQQHQEEARSESSYHQEYQQRQAASRSHEEEHHQHSAQEGHHVMEESTMLHITEQQPVQGEGRRPLPVPSRPNQVIQEHTSHHQVIGTSAGEGVGNGELVHAGQPVPGAPEYSVPDGFRGRVVQHHETQRQRSSSNEEVARRSHRDHSSQGRVDVTVTNGRDQQLNELEEAVRRGSNGVSKQFTPSRRADIPIEHDQEPEPTVEPEPGMGGHLEPEPEQVYPEPEPEPVYPEPEPEPGFVPSPTENLEPVDAGQGETVEYEETDQVICEEDEQQISQQQGVDQDYVSSCAGSPSMTATSSIFEHQVSMISVPIPAVIDHVSSSNSQSGSFMSSSHQQQQQQIQPIRPSVPIQHPQLVSGSQHVSSSSYSKTYITSGVVPMSNNQPAMIVQPVVTPSKSTMSSSSMSSSSMSSSSSGCQQTFTYKCQMVYGPTKRTKICETVPIETPVDCCSVC